MNEFKSMVEAARIAATYRERLVNILCRKCKMMVQRNFAPANKSEAAQQTSDAVKSQFKDKGLTAMFCPICQKRFAQISKDWEARKA